MISSDYSSHFYEDTSFGRRQRKSQVAENPDLAPLAAANLSRKPPRSKHDAAAVQDNNQELHFPSQDAASRVLIGTLMLNSCPNPKPPSRPAQGLTRILNFSSDSAQLIKANGHSQVCSFTKSNSCY